MTERNKCVQLGLFAFANQPPSSTITRRTLWKEIENQHDLKYIYCPSKVAACNTFFKHWFTSQCKSFQSQLSHIRNIDDHMTDWLDAVKFVNFCQVTRKYIKRKTGSKNSWRWSRLRASGCDVLGGEISPFNPRNWVSWRGEVHSL